ncbi:cell division protein FtsH, partial [bacterium]|nr:cell division protein FtsH [bacterium]
EYNANFSEQTFERIDKEVQKIIDEQYAFVVKMLHEHRDKLDVLAKALLEKETMYASEIYELLGITPRENLKLVE